MTSNKATKSDEIIRKPENDQDHRRTNSSIVKDAGLNLAGGAQKLSGPHQTRRKKPSRNRRYHQGTMRDHAAPESTSLTPPANQQRCSEPVNHLMEDRYRIQLEKQRTKLIFGQKHSCEGLFPFSSFVFKQF